MQRLELAGKCTQLATRLRTQRHAVSREGDCYACAADYVLSDAAAAGAQSCNAPSDNVCSCPNGTPTTHGGSGATLCETDGAVDCEVCATTGYHLSATAALGAQTCVQNVCTCPNGTPTTADAACATPRGMSST